MIISYKKLWKLLIDLDLKKKDLREMAGISPSTIAKLGRNENINTEVIIKICQALKCDICEIMEIKRSPTRAVGKWKPFFADATNYEVESLLSKAMGTEFVTLHHCEKGKQVTKETEISYFQIISVNSAIKEREGNWIVYVDKTPQKAESIFESS